MKKYLFLLFPLAFIISNMYFIQIESTLVFEPISANANTTPLTKTKKDQNETRMSSSKTIDKIRIPSHILVAEEPTKSGTTTNQDEIYLSSSKTIDELHGPIVRGGTALFILFLICAFIFRGTKMLLKRSTKQEKNTEEDNED